jgi:hypothetical protein
VNGRPCSTRWCRRPLTCSFKQCPRPRRHSGERERGYAYVMALFLIVAMLVTSQVVLQNLITLRRREREKEAIWRGEQYARAIRLYYHKTGHYPQSLDDLQKGMPELHFLRFCAYKDPINTSDGSWRFIYVNGSGQIIGSVRYATLQQMALMDLNGGKMPGTQPGAQVGTPAADLAASSAATDTNSTSNSAPQGSQPGASGPQQTTSDTQQGAPNSQQGSTAAPQSAFGSSATGAPAAGNSLNAALGLGAQANPLANLKPTGPVDGPVLGAFITGVASKMDRPSIKVYKGGKKYIEWEFIWNPLEDQARAVQNGLSPQGPQPGQLGLPIGPVNGAAAGQPTGSSESATPPPQNAPPTPSPNANPENP